MTAKDTLLEYCESRALALQAELEKVQKELELTKAFIYRDYDLGRGISAETTQRMIDNYIKTEENE